MLKNITFFIVLIEAWNNLLCQDFLCSFLDCCSRHMLQYSFCMCTFHIYLMAWCIVSSSFCMFRTCLHQNCHCCFLIYVFVPTFHFQRYQPHNELHIAFLTWTLLIILQICSSFLSDDLFRYSNDSRVWFLAIISFLTPVSTTTLSPLLPNAGKGLDFWQLSSIIIAYVWLCVILVVFIRIWLLAWL